MEDSIRETRFVRALIENLRPWSVAENEESFIFRTHEPTKLLFAVSRLVVSRILAIGKNRFAKETTLEQRVLQLSKDERSRSIIIWKKVFASPE